MFINGPGIIQFHQPVPTPWIEYVNISNYKLWSHTRGIYPLSIPQVSRKVDDQVLI